MRLRCLDLLLVGLLVLCVARPLHAQEYGALPDSIPDRFEASSIDRLSYSTLPSAVVRLESLRLVVEDRETATLFARKVVTVFDEDGRHHGRLRLGYDSFVEIEELEGRILDPEGETIKELDDEHINDRSSIGGSLYTDARVKIATLYDDRYPYTVEYRYEKELTAPMRWPTWYAGFKEAPMEFGQFEFVVPHTVAGRFHVRGDSLTSTVEEMGDRRVRRWRAVDQPAFDLEPHGPPWTEQATAVHVGPTQFEAAGTSGDQSSWSAFGQWYNKLKTTRNELSTETAREMHALVEGAPTRRDSIRRLYRHVQEGTRYVSVQLGIGGWQPFPVSYVRERGYGDCKALTNYMEASLEAVGISAHPVLINRGFDVPTVPPAFPNGRFNHVVLAVPVAQDTLWLENTDIAPAFGFVGADIADRRGLMVTPDGGELVRTPTTRAVDNHQRREATVSLQPDGSGTASVRTAYTGNNQYLTRSTLSQKTVREKKEWLRDRIDVPSFDLKNVDFSEMKVSEDTTTLPFELGLPRYASKTGSRLFLPLNLLGHRMEVPPEMTASRTQPVHAHPFPFVDVDSIRFALPSGFAVEAAPDPITIETDFATYEATVERQEDALVYRRRLEWRKKSLPHDRYEEYRTFLRNVAKAEEMQAVLIERES